MAEPRDPKGWTSRLYAADRIALTLSRCTGLLNIRVRLGEIEGGQFLFQSGDNFYLWRNASEEGAQITWPKTYDEIVQQLESDATKIQVRALDG